MTRRRYWILACTVGIAFGLVAIVIVVLPRSSIVKAKVVSEMSSRLELDVTLDHLSVSFFPSLGINGGGLVLRVPNRPDLPPFISIEKFRVFGGVRDFWQGHFHSARLDGLKITIPPGDDKKALSSPGGDGKKLSQRVIIDRIETPNAELNILRSKPGRPPLRFEIHELTLTDVGFDREIPFHAKLTNPVPRGLVDSTGRVGPFPRGRPHALPVSGDYTFEGADLDTLRGLAGTLTSSGRYTGVLSKLNVSGKSETPNFSLDLGGTPLPLSATFDVIVNGTNGTTELTRVDARLVETDIHVSGLVDNLPGPGNRAITMKATIVKGRMEDLLRLVVNSGTSPISGSVDVQASVALMPGPERARQRLHVSGTLALAAAHFTQPQVQAKIAELSHRAQGRDRDELPTDVFANVRSGFALDHGVLSLADLRFDVPGAGVTLDGRYEVNSGALDFQGELRMEAEVSRAVGGWKGKLAKPVDWVFRRDGAGAVIPISVSGTRQSPGLNIRLGAVVRRSGGDEN